MILVDNRAGSCDLVHYSPLKEIGTLCHLDSADVCFTGNGASGPILVGVEVKSTFDLISSLNTGRLQAEQIPKMIAQYDVRWLLHYGHYRPSPADGVTLQIRRRAKGKKTAVWTDYRLGTRPVPYGYIESFLCSPSFTSTGILSKHAHDITEAVAWIGVLYRTWQKDYSKHKSMRVLNTAQNMPIAIPEMDERTLLKAKVASQLPAIGYERAMAAAQHFGSVREMVNADAGEWAKIGGIGKVIGQAVERAVK